MTLPDPTAPSSSHRYIPNAGEDIREMLAVIGVDSIDALFETIPAAVKLTELLDIPGPVRRSIRALVPRIAHARDGRTRFVPRRRRVWHYQPSCLANAFCLES